MKKAYSFKTKAALTVTIILWASAFVGIRAGLKGYSPGGLALFRLLIASVCMSFIYWRWPNKANFQRVDIFLILLFGAIGLGAYNIFLNYGEISVSSGIASFIISQSPLITLVLSVFFLKEQFNIFMLIGILISIFGVGLISLGEHNGYQFDKGVIYVLLSALISGLYSVMQKPFLKKYHSIDVTVLIIWGGTLSLIFYFPNLIHDMHTASLNATLAVIYLGIFPAAVAYMAWSYALSQIPASRCATFLYFMPIVATLLGWLCLGEVPAWLSLTGGIIALAGVWVASIG